MFSIESSCLYVFQLFDRRAKGVRDNERKHWEQLSIEYMSLESSDDEDSGVIVIHHLPWRSKSKYTSLQYVMVCHSTNNPFHTVCFVVVWGSACIKS